MGRRPWTDRLTVEECASLSTQSLGRFNGLSYLRSVPSTLTWSEGNTLVGIGCRLTWEDDELVVRLSNDSSYPEVLFQEQHISTTSSRCEFGGKRLWFICPGLHAMPCGRRCSALYIPLGTGVFACRLCHNLTYRSVQQHDKRLDRLVANPWLVSSLLESLNVRDRFLALKAVAKSVSNLSLKKGRRWT